VVPFVAVPSGPGESAVLPSGSGQSAAAAMQLAVGLLTASLDSPELEAWAIDEFAPRDTDGLDDLLAGLHVVSLVLLHELENETGEPSTSVLQRLAITAERRRGTASDS
jgi:hypothetical protein